ncbi:MAG: diacylglycerol kinase family protein [FCB group bacterium]|jgi:diacylglycerol kinase family enzyme
MKTLLIINPYSRSGKSAKLSEVCKGYLKERNFQFETAELQNFDDAYKFSLEANRNGYDNIIALGGDGTINKVINGFYDSVGNRISAAKFGVIYTGTSPDFCKSYGIPINIIKASITIINQRTREIPVGMIKFKPSLNSDNYITNYFGCCANIGLGASLARKANSGIRKYFGDFGGTLISLLQLLVKYRGTNYTIVRDGTEVNEQNVINLSVGITNLIASGIKVPVKEDMADSEMYLLTAAKIRLSNFAKLIYRVYSGKEFKNSEFLFLEYAKKIEIKQNSVHPEIEFDGDPAGYLPCTIEIAKDKLKIIY